MRLEVVLKELVLGMFDVIMLWYVMEYLEYLDEMWELLCELLIEKGVLIVVVFNCLLYDVMKYGKYWVVYDVFCYLWYFMFVMI